MIAKPRGDEQATSDGAVLFEVLGEGFGCLGSDLEEEVFVGLDIDGREIAVPSPRVTFLAGRAVGRFARHGAVTVPVCRATDQAIARDDRGEVAGRGCAPEVKARAGVFVRYLERESGHELLQVVRVP